MDNTLKNVTEIERALSKSSLGNEMGSSSINGDTDIKNESSYNTHKVTNSSGSNARNETFQYSTSQMLHNLSGLQTSANTKIDVLNDSILRLTKGVNELLEESRKQTDVMSRMAQNISNLQINDSMSSENSKSNIQASRKLKDFGFNNSVALTSEFIMNILKQAEIQIAYKGKRYRSSRTFERNMLDKAIEVAREETRFDSYLEIPETKSEAAKYLASRVGSTDSLKPILNSDAIHQLINDPRCRIMISTVEQLIPRLCKIRAMIPYYEADILNSIVYPYFDVDGKLICNWDKLNPRNETKLEASIMNLKVEKRKKIGRMLIVGVDLEAAMNAIDD